MEKLSVILIQQKYGGYLSPWWTFILEKYEAGFSFRTIAKELDRRGVQTYGTDNLYNDGRIVWGAEPVYVSGEIFRLSQMVRYVVKRSVAVQNGAV